MKRYEKLSGAEIVALMEQCNKAHYDLADCPIGKGNLGVCPDDCLLAWLKSDVQLVPRWQTAKTQEDMDRLYASFLDEYCNKNTGKNGYCNGCKYLIPKNNTPSDCYNQYLNELVDISGCKMTNGDIFRSKTDEELANWIVDFDPKECHITPNSYDFVLTWLKKEAKDND